VEVTAFFDMQVPSLAEQGYGTSNNLKFYSISLDIFSLILVKIFSFWEISQTCRQIRNIRVNFG